MKYTLYLVGGIIRDELLGLHSKDIDYSVIIDQDIPPEDAFKGFCDQITVEGYTIFKKSPETFTVRAKFPKGHVNEKQDADFVIARKELGYIKGTRTPEVVLGTLEDDIFRRDFTVNALVKDMDGNIIDLVGGQKDLQLRILRTPSDTAASFNDDPLRILRGMRFSITKGLDWSDEMWRALETFDSKKLSVVSSDRIRIELGKCLEFSTPDTLQFLWAISKVNAPLYAAIFPDDLWLVPTLAKR